MTKYTVIYSVHICTVMDNPTQHTNLRAVKFVRVCTIRSALKHESALHTVGMAAAREVCSVCARGRTKGKQSAAQV
jgi:hypothetical protein